MECQECPYYNYSVGGQYCEKVGGLNSSFGFCQEVYPEIVKQKKYSKKRRNKRERNQKHKRHLKFLAENILGYPSIAYPVDKYGKCALSNEWFNLYPKINFKQQEIAYYKRIYRGQRSKYLKRISHKKIRLYDGKIPKGNWCHKLYDFFWEMY